MKTLILPSIVLAAALGGFLASPLSASSEKPISKAYAVQTVTRDGAAIVTVGTTEFTVNRLLGRPDRKLTRDVWAYFRFVGSRDEAQQDGCSTLLITIANGRVADMKLVNNHAMDVIVAHLKVNPAAGAHMYAAGE